MKFPLAPAIAWRYLFSKKSHSAVTAIAAVSVAGVAFATAAIVCVLSVFNGFQNVITGRVDRLAPDVLVTPAKGKFFQRGDSLAEALTQLPEVALATPTVSDNALALSGSREMPVTLKGVDEKAFRRVTEIDSLMVSLSPFLLTDERKKEGPGFYYDPDLQEYIEIENNGEQLASISVGVANRLALRGEEAQLLLFAPRRTGRVNLANPISSFLRDSLPVSGVWQSQQSEMDKDMVIVDLGVARRMFQLEDEASSLEILATEGTDAVKAADAVRSALGEGFTVKDRAQQREVSYKMIKIEKWITFLLLAFILVIASFNIISTLSMLILDKQQSLSVFHSLGMDKSRIGKVFGWESILVSLLGAAIGIAAGVCLCLLQQEYGFIKLNGDPTTLVVHSYPVELRGMDILAALVPVVAIGLVTAVISSRYAIRRVAYRLAV